jgi:hypothetical protein
MSQTPLRRAKFGSNKPQDIAAHARTQAADAILGAGLYRQIATERLLANEKKLPALTPAASVEFCNNSRLNNYGK